VYATCSLLQEENEQIADAFLATHPDYRLVNANEILAQQKIDLDTGVYLKLLPHLHQTDGFFAAVFEKEAAVVVEKKQPEPTIAPAELAVVDEQPAPAKPKKVATKKAVTKKAPAAKKVADEKEADTTPVQESPDEVAPKQPKSVKPKVEKYESTKAKSTQAKVAKT